MKQHILYTFIFISLLSCTKTIDFDDEEYANQVIVNGVISPDRHFLVSLQKSNSIMTKSDIFQSVEGSMELFEDGVLIKQFPKQDGGFLSQDIFPKPGKNYKMVISSEGKEIVTETTIPNKVEVISVDTTSVKTPSGYRTTVYKIKFKDTTGDDYYRVVVMKETIFRFVRVNAEHKKVWAYSKQNYQTMFQSEDPVFKSVYNNFGDEEVIDIGPKNDYFIFPDDYFDGKEYTLQFNIMSSGYGYYVGNGYYYSGYNPVNSPNGEGVIFERNTVHIQRLSKDLFTYLKYLKLYNHYRDFPFAEPVPVYSNVKNGVGIFAGFNDESKYSFEKIYIPFSMDTIKFEENTGSYGY